jgi:beta-glucosidase
VHTFSLHTIPPQDPAGAACDHWNRLEEDCELIKSLGVGAYRMSIEWSKVQPSETKWDQAAIDHYHDEIDRLRKNEIEVMVTLHHFSQPIWFDDLGGFEKMENKTHFIEYSKRMLQEFGGKVQWLATFNEPNVFVTGGWVEGNFPPSKKDDTLAGKVLRNILQWHLDTYSALKLEPGGKELQIGIVLNHHQFDPYHYWNPLDCVVAYLVDSVFNESMLGFFRHGHYYWWTPDMSEAVKHSDARAPASNDFIGMNYYSNYYAKFKLDLVHPFAFVTKPEEMETDMDYAVYPEGFHRALARFTTLKKPIYITENGIADATDTRRHFFIARYLGVLSRALREGMDLRGYFYWSFLDNYEWDEGYKKRFGLIEVNYETQERKLRDGSKLFVDVVKRHRNGELQ